VARAACPALLPWMHLVLPRLGTGPRSGRVAAPTRTATTSERDVAVVAPAAREVAEVIGPDRRRHLLAPALGARGTAGARRTRAAATSDEAHVHRHDLLGVALLPFLVLPLPRA